MAQKINPTSLRLGTTQIWNVFFQNYGKSYHVYFKILYKHLRILEVLNQIYLKKNIIIDHKNIWYSKNQVFLNIYYTNFLFSSKINYLLFLKVISQIIFKSYLTGGTTRFYLQSKWFTTANLIGAYAQYLLNNLGSPKKLLWNICTLLQTHLNSYKISYSKNGPICIALKGFKIRIVGRFDNSKNQMSKSIEQYIGVLPLVCLNSHVEFLNKEIYTKLGVCSLQIWLFYKIY
uniref:Ribosomal protein S3 n=1 Tax=Schimmelmannia schousboei TaxID=173468 RepID=A0A0E3DB61_9FLOR|nr:ribosomal protein S3 [Schimmelmannia schousboei]